MLFIEGERNAQQYLLVLTTNRSRGVIISDVPFSGCLLPILINEGKITELSPEWGPIRKALIGSARISEFKKWLFIEMNNPSNFDDHVSLDLKDGRTVVIEKGTLELETFKDVFFTDETHKSSSLFKFGQREDYGKFSTSRGSKWLANALLGGGFSVSLEGEPSIIDETELSFEEIFSNKK